MWAPHTWSKRLSDRIKSQDMEGLLAVMREGHAEAVALDELERWYASVQLQLNQQMYARNGLTLPMAEALAMALPPTVDVSVTVLSLVRKQPDLHRILPHLMRAQVSENAHTEALKEAMLTDAGIAVSALTTPEILAANEHQVVRFLVQNEMADGRLRPASWAVLGTLVDWSAVIREYTGQPGFRWDVLDHLACRVPASVGQEWIESFPGQFPQAEALARARSREQHLQSEARSPRSRSRTRS